MTWSDLVDLSLLIYEVKLGSMLENKIFIVIGIDIYFCWPLNILYFPSTEVNYAESLEYIYFYCNT